jgi:hypothetical protein
MSSFLLTYTHVPKQTNSVQTFDGDIKIIAGKWQDALVEFEKSDEGNIGDFFAKKVEEGYFEGNEILTLALNGFKEPHDDQHRIREMLQRRGSGDISAMLRGLTGDD